jgi:NADP-reducing hydrogenase subunit HndB
MEELAKSNLKDVAITTSGCAGLCSQEPMITIELSGAPPVKYTKLNEDKTRKIFTEHVINGNPVKEYALVVGHETTY